MHQHSHHHDHHHSTRAHSRRDFLSFLASATVLAPWAFGQRLKSFIATHKTEEENV